VKNVTGGLYSILGSLPSHVLKGRTLLVAADCFPSLHFLLQKLALRLGFTLRTVPLSAGLSYVTDDDFINAWDDSVGLALVTWVSSTSSHRVDVDRMAQCATEHGSLMALDLTQAAGLVPFTVHEGVAFTLSASLKWACGVSGASLLHVRADLIEQCEPEFRGWFSQENPFNWNLDQFSYADGARRFDHGTPAILGSIASLPGMRFVLETGVEKTAGAKPGIDGGLAGSCGQSQLARADPIGRERARRQHHVARQQCPARSGYGGSAA